MGFPGGSDGKESTCNVGDSGSILEKAMATHSSTLAWKIPGTEEPGGCCLWGRTESDTTDATQQQQQQVPSLGREDPLEKGMAMFGGSKITADGDYSHEIKRHLLLGRKVMTNLDSIFKSRDITLPTKVSLVKATVFPVVIYGCESWTVKKAEH